VRDEAQTRQGAIFGCVSVLSQQQSFEEQDLTLRKKEKECTLRFPRGAKGRILPLSERLLKELENYWRAQRQRKQIMTVRVS
jgi:hypothetical protein